MANINIRREHHLGQKVAKERVEEIANTLQEKSHAKWSWQGESLNFKRSGASGSVAVGEDFVEFNIKLSMLLAPMKGSIEQAIQEQVDKALA